MKLRGILEIALLIVLICISIKTDFTYDENKAKNYIGLNNDKDSTIIASNNSILSSKNNSDETIIEYVNESSSAVSIGVSNIDIICHGSGINKEQDEILAKKNIHLSVYFSLTKNGEKFTSLVLDKKEKVYIHIIKEYIGDEYPLNDVNCDYSITT